MQATEEHCRVYFMSAWAEELGLEGAVYVERKGYAFVSRHLLFVMFELLLLYI